MEPYLLSPKGTSFGAWRAVDEHGAKFDILVQKQRDKAGQSHQPTRERETRKGIVVEELSRTLTALVRQGVQSSGQPSHGR